MADAFTAFQRALRTSEPLNQEQQFALAYAARGGDDEARRRLIECNLPVVVDLAYKRRNVSMMPLMDLIQAGSIGLILASDRFDPERGIPFAAYATFWIRREMQTAMAREADGRHSVPLHRLQDVKRAASFEREFSDRTGRRPTLREISTGLGLRPDVVEGLQHLARPLMSLFSRGHEEDDSDQPFDVPTPFADPFESEEAFRSAVRRSLSLAGVTPREMLVLERLFGLCGRDEEEGRQTLDMVGEALGVSGERVRQIRECALLRIRNSPAAMKLLKEWNR